MSKKDLTQSMEVIPPAAVDFLEFPSCFTYRYLCIALCLFKLSVNLFALVIVHLSDCFASLSS